MSISIIYRENIQKKLSGKNLLSTKKQLQFNYPVCSQFPNSVIVVEGFPSVANLKHTENVTTNTDFGYLLISILSKPSKYSSTSKIKKIVKLLCIEYSVIRKNIIGKIHLTQGSRMKDPYGIYNERMYQEIQQPLLCWNYINLLIEDNNNLLKI